MIIPDLENTYTRYYVAIDEKTAYSSWISFEEADNCINDLRKYQMMDYVNNIVGIIMVSKTEKCFVRKIK